MSNLHIGNITSGRDTNIQSNVNNSKFSFIEKIRNEVKDDNTRVVLDELLAAIKKKDEPSIEDCVKKLGRSAVTLYKLTSSALKAIL